MENVNEINWSEEYNELEESKEFLKLEQGIHHVKFLDNGVKTERTFEKEDKKEIKQQVNFAVMNKGSSYIFSVNVSNSKVSLYGQLAALGKHHGSLKNRIVEIQVIGSGKKKRYTIGEALKIIENDKEEVIE